MRRFIYTVSEAFWHIRRQPCFSRVDGAEIRRQMRCVGTVRLAAPEGGKMRDRTRQLWPKWGAPHPSWIRTRAYSEQDLAWVAKSIPFRCPFCGNDEHPIQYGELWFPRDATLICRDCHKTQLRGVMLELYALNKIASQLLRGQHNEGHSRPQEHADCGSQRTA